MPLSLGRLDDGCGGAGGLGPGGVVVSFDVPFQVFAFDDPGVRASPSARVEQDADPLGGDPPEMFKALRGESRAPG